MKHIKLSLVILLGILFSFTESNGAETTIPTTEDLSNTSLSVPCHAPDSLALIALFNSTNGFSWTNTWQLFSPVCTWYGVTLNPSGRVTHVQLGTNFLFGTLPSDLGVLTELEILELDANRLSGTIPPAIGNCTKLTRLWLDNNMFSGGVPSTFGSLVELQSFFIDDNNLTLPLPNELENLTSLLSFFMDNNEIPGAIPEGMKDLPFFSRFELFNNQIDSLPDMISNGSFSGNNRLKFQNNKLTFDDVLPNMGPQTGIYYHPQDSIGIPSVQNVTTGSFYTFDLDIDDGISNNDYEWFKDGSPMGVVINSNQFTIGPLDFTDAGVYTCQVTNPGAPLLTLYSRPIELVVSCGVSVFEMRDTLCPGTTVIVNGTTYSESLPNGVENLGPVDQYGCDSTINVNLTFQQPPVDTFAQLFCPGQSIEVNGTIYDKDRPTGTEVFEDAIGPGCDSTVFVDLTFINNSELLGELIDTICLDSSITINGNVYDIDVPFGLETLVGEAVNGCDSVITIFLSFYPEVESTFDPMVCGNDTFVINGTQYYPGNAIGEEIIENATVNGCDSTVHVNIQYSSAIVFEYRDTLCPDGEVIINGTTYNLSSPIGTETFFGVLPGGCDSIVDIELDFYTIQTENYSEMICPRTSVVINGETFDSDNTSNLQTLTDASQFGCDSMVNVTISFYPEAVGTYTDTICPEDSISLNGVWYHFGNSSGFDTLPGLSANGCDSIVDVDISFWPAAIGTYTDELCASGSVVINGTTYDINRPTGSEILMGASQHFCDSTVNITLTFTPDPEEDFEPLWCPDEFVIINGNTYDVDNRTGQEIVPSMASPGCDSIINIDLNFIAVDTVLYDPQFCPGGSVVINGNTYDVTTPTGQEILTSVVTGCDSVVNVALSFGSEIIENYTPTFCCGDSVIINGTIYNKQNPMGSESFPGMGQGGCDSTLVIDITYLPEAIGSHSPTICSTDVFEIVGEVFDTSRPVGQVLLPGWAQGGCDSTLNINLSFYPEATGQYAPTICAGDTLTINGTDYHAAFNTGVETLVGIAEHGCDSIVTVNLSFYPEATGIYEPTICLGDTLNFNGTDYHAAFTSGTETLEGIAAHGCDSIVTVNLSFYPEATGLYEPIICAGDTLNFNGTDYHANNLTGIETLIGIAEHGCDSLVTVELDFFDPVIGTYEPTICNGDSLIINGTVYNEDFPIGSEVLPNMAANGCDSTVNISLSFNSMVVTPVGGFLCFGESEVVNGVVYDALNTSGSDTLNTNGTCDSILDINFFFYPESIDTLAGVYCDSVTFTIGTQIFGPDNPQGVVILENANSNGCDSTVHVDLEFYLNNDSTIVDTYCPDEFLIVGTQRFDIGNPSGEEILFGAAQGGCDSTVTVALTFIQPDILTEIYEDILCAEDSVSINGTWYHAGNPTGIEIIPNGSVDGCDSTIDVRLTFLQAPAIGSFVDNFCEGASIEINGTIYDSSNPTGQELFVNGSSQGCDSLVNISLTFDASFTTNIDTTLCQGNSLIIDNEVYDSPGSFMISSMSSSGCDSIINLTLSFDDPFALGMATAGIDDVSCTEESMLFAEANNGQTGFWSSTGNAIVDHINQAESAVSNLQPGDNQFIWSVSTDFCSSYDQDTVILTYYPLPEPRSDSFYVDFGINLFELDLLANDSFPEGVESPFTIEVNLDQGGIIMQEDTLIEFIPQLGYDGMAIGTYAICGTFCPDNCLEAPFAIEVAGRAANANQEWDVPNGITPNNDGTNDVLILDPLIEHPDLYENNELMIFNRWGNVVYSASPYLNDWNGVTQSGKDLPEGTYYYVLRLDLNAGKVFKGDITILR